MAKYDSNVHHRRSIRLKNYDYRQAGCYYVTICINGHECLLGSVTDARVELNTLGCIIDSCWNALPQHFPHATLDAFVVMPNHLHGIIRITEQATVGARHAVPLQQPPFASKEEAFGKPVSGSLATLVRSFKSASTRQVNHILGTPGERLWQRNYFEKIILDETELARTRDYIHTNPERWKAHEASYE